LLNLLLDKGRTNDFEIFLTDKDGSQHPCTINVVLIKDEQDHPIKFIGSLRNISERKQLEAQLRHAQKMESMGTLAGGIAHEFNNMLGIIIGNTELAADDIPDWSPAKECLDEIRSASIRASNVVQQILSFARKDVTEREPVQLTPIIKESLKLLRVSFPAKIEISQDISCAFDTVLANPTQISQVLMNLCTNAAQAMSGKGGVLKVSLKNVEFENQDAGFDVTPGPYVQLTVSDTGQGIEPEIMDRIFDPYFTTKEMGQGMGLSVVHGIVKSCHGIITVHSAPEKGSAFEVLLPVIDAETKRKAEEPDTLPTGSEHILFVDDEPSLVNMVRQILERLGYEIETKLNPIEALELFRSRPDQFDLVITDMTMPEMTGLKLVKEILNIRPDLPIILCTGYSEKISKEKAEELGIKTLLFKPFAVHDFALTVRKVLDENNS
jgi:signal transduction histidine kinase/ActR/RegA family two-component response regulator